MQNFNTVFIVTIETNNKFSGTFEFECVEKAINKLVDNINPHADKFKIACEIVRYSGSSLKDADCEGFITVHTPAL
jgi:hypothetical protein